MALLNLRVTRVEQWDICSVCGVYAELDNLERIVCRVCTLDATHPGFDTISLIESLRSTESYHPLSRIGTRVRLLKAAIDRAEAWIEYIERKYTRSYGIRPDKEAQIESLYRHIGDWEAEIADLIGDFAPLKA